jgi:protein disulfide isomerase
MKVLCLIAIAFIAAVSAKENVLTLTTSNFDSVVNNADFIVVEFYAPWCGHCKSLAPEYEKAATELLKNDPPINLAKVDATAETELGTRFGVRGYPTIKIFRNGEHTEYEGPRDAAGIVNYVKKQSGPASKPLETDEAVESFLAKQTDAIVLGVFSDKSSAKYSTFTKTANSLRDKFTFAETFASGAASKYVADGVALIQPQAFQSKLEHPLATTTDLSSSVILKSWINKNSLPLVGVFDENTAERYDAAKKPVVTVWANIDFKLDPKGSNYVANRVRKIAQQFPDVLFAVADIRARSAGQTLAQHGISASDLFAVTAKSAEGFKYVFKGLTNQPKGFKAEGLETFVQDLIDGKLEPYLKSEDEPAQSTVEGVTTLTAKTFARETDGKAALIEFYAPWCGHCKSLAPTWDKLGKQLENEDVVIAKMDATANDVPPAYEVQGFPTLFFKHADGKIEKYQGGRDLKDFTKFLNGKVKLSAAAKKEL